MASRLLDRVRESTAAGEFYTALQLIKSFWNRLACISAASDAKVQRYNSVQAWLFCLWPLSKKTSAFSEAVTAALECSKLFAAAGQGEAACEAACLCVQAWTEGSIRADDDKTRACVYQTNVLFLITTFASCPGMLMEIAGSLPAGKPQYDLLSACVKWVALTVSLCVLLMVQFDVRWTQSTGDQGSCVEFHHLAAMSAWASVAYPEATSHFVHAKQPAK
jgi:Golgi to ER traffic protein 4